MTAKEDKKTPARVGRVPGLILDQPWGRPSLAGGLNPRRKAQGYRGQDSVDGGMFERYYSSSSKKNSNFLCR